MRRRWIATFHRTYRAWPLCFCFGGYRCGAHRALTEAEYAALLPRRMNAIAADLNDRFADVLPDGCRFEWTAD